MIKMLFISTAALLVFTHVHGASAKLHTFQTIRATDQFWAEGADCGDFNRDGQGDVASGPFWYPGPKFQTRHVFRPATQTFERTRPDGSKEKVPGYEGALGSRNAYSDNFFTFVYDFNRDGWDDILVIGLPGTECAWYENPGNPKNADGSPWPRHAAFGPVDNESPALTDLTGDGRPELVCNAHGYFGYATPDWEHPERPWTYHPITPKGKYHKYTHGLGVGDVNGDGRPDLIEQNGWWEHPASLDGDPVWKFHPYPFAPQHGAAQMYAYDFNGDGLNDVFTTLNPHGFGLAWYEQVRKGNTITFKPHVFLNSKPEDNRYGVKFSQAHAIALADIDGDGLQDVVTGKRFWAHGPSGDVEPNAPAVLYWFRTVRLSSGGVDFVPHLVHDDSGVGTQVVVCDVNRDKWPDIVVGNKKGLFIHLHQVREVSQAEWERAQPKPIH